MAFHVKHNTKLKYLAPLLKLISDEKIPCVERMWKCEGKCFDPLTPERMITLHYTWKFPSGSEWFLCTKCGASIHFDNEVDREIDLLEPELQVKARTDYKAYQKEVMDKVESTITSKRKSDQEYNRRVKDGK